MEFTIIFSFIPEIYLSVSILIFLLFNLMVLNISKFNFPVLKLQMFSQVMTILVCLCLLFFQTSTLGEQDAFTLLVQCKALLILPKFTPKTTNVVKLWFHGLVRSWKVQLGIGVFILLVSYCFVYGAILTAEPLKILIIFSVLFLMDFLKNEYATRLGRFSKSSIYIGTIFSLTVLILLEFTRQLFQLLYYFMFFVIVGFLHRRFSLTKLLYSKSSFLGNILKTDVESMQIINLHLHCDLPGVQLFFQHSVRGILFLWTILLSPTVRGFLGISESGQLYSVCLIISFFIFKFFIFTYLQFGCNPTIAELLASSRTFIGNSLKYAGASIFSAGVYTFDSPHKVADLLSEDVVAGFQNAIGVNPNTNSIHEEGIKDAHYLKSRGVNFEFNNVRDPNNPKVLNVSALSTGKQMLDAGASNSEVSRYIHNKSVSKGAVKLILPLDKESLSSKTDGLINGTGSAIMDDFFLKGKK